jgi:hypothetical protein
MCNNIKFLFGLYHFVIVIQNIIFNIKLITEFCFDKISVEWKDETYVINTFTSHRVWKSQILSVSSPTLYPNLKIYCVLISFFKVV